MESKQSTLTQQTSDTSEADIPSWEPVKLDLTVRTPIPEVTDDDFPFDDDIPW